MQNDVPNVALNGLSRTMFNTRDERFYVNEHFPAQRTPLHRDHVRYHRRPQTYVSKQSGCPAARGSQLLLRRWQSPSADPGTMGCFISAFSKTGPERIHKCLWSSFTINRNTQNNKTNRIYRALDLNTLFALQIFLYKRMIFQKNGFKILIRY